MPDRFITIDGKGRPIVLLHAGGLDSRMFDADVPALARLGRVFAMTAPVAAARRLPARRPIASRSSTS